MPLQPSSYTKFMVSLLPVGSRIPTQHTLTVGANAAEGATSLTVTALTGFLAAGRKLTVGGVEITVSANAPRGAVSVPINPLTSGQTIATGATTTYVELLEFLGGESVNISANENVINVRNFKSGQWSESTKVMTGATIECDGQFLSEDLSLTAILRPAFFSLDREVYAEITRGNGDRWTGSWLVSGYSESAALDNVVRVRFTLNSQGAIGIPAEGVLTAA